MAHLETKNRFARLFQRSAAPPRAPGELSPERGGLILIYRRHSYILIKDLPGAPGAHVCARVREVLARGGDFVLQFNLWVIFGNAI